MKKTEKKCCMTCANCAQYYMETGKFYCSARHRLYVRNHVCRYYLTILPFDA